MNANELAALRFLAIWEGSTPVVECESCGGNIRHVPGKPNKCLPCVRGFWISVWGNLYGRGRKK